MLIDTLATEMLYCTVKITNYSSFGESVGTGFVFDASRSEGRRIRLLISNKHVFQNAERLRLDFLVRNADHSAPEFGALHSVEITDSAHEASVGHPDAEVDVAALALNNVLDSIPAERQPYYRYLQLDTFPDPEDEADMDSLEQLIFVGYPNGHSDPKYHTPIYRQAISATPIALPFGGKPTFLLDGSVFGGSSGSPVFIYNKGSFIQRDTAVFGSRLMLVGIVSSTLVRHAELPLEVATAPHTKLAQELNLGIAYNWHAIDETADAVCARYGVSRDKADTP